jgi:hypothetical protein
MLPDYLKSIGNGNVGTSFGNQRVDKCSHKIRESFHLKNLSSKARKFIACCYTYQRVKRPNRQYMTAEGHLPSQTRLLCAVDV